MLQNQCCRERRDKMRPAVSIVMPVYNVEIYLMKAVGSILCQTLREIELILVDDGSPDNCGRLADMYAKMDERISVIHQENAGLGLARNAGLEAARGEYVGFVDPDDWVDARMYEAMYQTARIYDGDIVMCSCVREKADERSEVITLPLKEGIYGKDAIRCMVLLPMIARDFDNDPWKSVINSVWKNIYRRELLLQNRILFLSERLIYAEDLLFNLKAFAHAERLCVINQPYYHYRYNVSSLSNVYRADFNRMNLLLYREIEQFTEKYGLGGDCEDLLHKRMIEMTFAMVINVLKPRNPAGTGKKIRQIREVLKLPQVSQAVGRLESQGLPFARKLMHFCLKKKLSCLIYLIFKYRIMR